MTWLEKRKKKKTVARKRGTVLGRDGKIYNIHPVSKKTKQQGDKDWRGFVKEDKNGS